MKLLAFQYAVGFGLGLLPFRALPAQADAAPLGLHNPIGDPPIHLRDPFVLPYGKKYFLYGTASPSQGFQCYESEDLVKWKLDGWAWRMSGLRVARGELHSPQVFLYQGMFCMVYSARTPGGIKLSLAASNKPEGPYHDLHAPWLPLAGSCAEGYVFVENKRKAYLVFTQRGTRVPAIYGVALNADLSASIGVPERLIQPSQRWELAHRDLELSNDSPAMFRIGSKYYLLYSANMVGTTERGIGYATADQPLGTWEKSSENPLLSSHPRIELISPAHGSVFCSNERKEWYVVYQSLADSANPSGDTIVNIDRLTLEDIRTLAIAQSPRLALPR